MDIKPIIWVASSKRDLKSFPAGAQQEIGYALHLAQIGDKSEKAKPFKGFGNAAVLEIVEYDVGGTYRAVYTVRFEKIVVVLHVFQKKSTHGIKTSMQDVDLIRSRFNLAQKKYDEWLLEGEEKS
jgi:phage-related protein